MTASVGVYRFHVDKMSSAHVYLRMKVGQDWRSLSDEVIEDCSQLVKANSIQGTCRQVYTFLHMTFHSIYYMSGCKESKVTIVYTPWENLRKSGSMDAGQVGFHNNKEVDFVNLKAN